MIRRRRRVAALVAADENGRAYGREHCGGKSGGGKVGGGRCGVGLSSSVELRRVWVSGFGESYAGASVAGWFPFRSWVAGWIHFVGFVRVADFKGLIFLPVSVKAWRVFPSTLFLFFWGCQHGGGVRQSRLAGIVGVLFPAFSRFSLFSRFGHFLVQGPKNFCRHGSRGQHQHQQGERGFNAPRFPLVCRRFGLQFLRRRRPDGRR